MTPGRLHLLERAGAAPPVVLLHGNSASSLAWSRLIEEPVLAGTRLVALDWPGHGHSARPAPTDPHRYGLRWYAEVLVSSLDAVGARDAVIVGHSLGGHIALEALARGLLSDVRALMILGTPPLRDAADIGSAYLPVASMSAALSAELDEDAIATWAREAFAPAPPPAWFADAVRATDPEARSRLGASVAVDGLADEVAAIAAATIPIAVVHPTRDAFVAPAAFARLPAHSLWRRAPIPLEGLGHYAQWQAPAVVAAVVAELVSDTVGLTV